MSCLASPICSSAKWSRNKIPNWEGCCVGDARIHGEGQDSAWSTGNNAHTGPFTCCQPVPALASSFSARPCPTYCFTPRLSTPLGQFYADEGLVCLSPHPDLCLRPQTCTLHLSPCRWGPPTPACPRLTHRLPQSTSASSPSLSQSY